MTFITLKWTDYNSKSLLKGQNRDGKPQQTLDHKTGQLNIRKKDLGYVIIFLYSCVIILKISPEIRKTSGKFYSWYHYANTFRA